MLKFNKKLAEYFYTCVDMLNEHGWCKGAWIESDGRMCAAEIAYRATLAMGNEPRFAGKLSHSEYYYARYEMMDKYAEEHGFESVVHFNDHTFTMREDIIKMFNTCAQRALALGPDAQCAPVPQPGDAK